MENDNIKVLNLTKNIYEIHDVNGYSHHELQKSNIISSSILDSEDCVRIINCSRGICHDSTLSEIIDDLVKKYKIDDVLQCVFCCSSIYGQGTSASIDHLPFRLMTEYGIDPHFNNEYLLSLAIQNNSSDLIKYLIEDGANLPKCIDCHMRYNTLPYNHMSLDLFKYLINAGLKIDMEQLLQDAIIVGRYDLFDFIMEFSPKISDECFYGSIQIGRSQCVRKMIPYVDLDKVGLNSMMNALEIKNYELTKLFLENGVAIPTIENKANQKTQLVQLLREYQISDDNIIKILCQ